MFSFCSIGIQVRLGNTEVLVVSLTSRLSGLSKHIQDNQGREIEWRNQIIIHETKKKKSVQENDKKKTCINLRANDDGSLMNPAYH